MRRVFLAADGRQEDIPQPMNMTQICAKLGADCLDTVNLRDGTVLIVDDQGYQKGAPANEAATLAYWSVCKPGTTHVIRGDAVIVPDADFGGEESYE